MAPPTPGGERTRRAHCSGLRRSRRRSPEFLREQIERLEQARIVTGMRAQSEEQRRLDAEAALLRRDYGLLDDPAD